MYRSFQNIDKCTTSPQMIYYQKHQYTPRFTIEIPIKTKKIKEIHRYSVEQIGGACVSVIEPCTEFIQRIGKQEFEIAKINEIIQMGEVIEGYKNRMLLEEKEKKEEDYISRYLDNNVILVNPEINKQTGLNKAFETVIETALSEITKVLDEEFLGKIGYLIEIYIFQDYENPDWRTNVIRIKVPINNPRYVLQLWDKVSDRVWDKIFSIEENAEEIEKVEDNTRIALDILE